ncbi:hypothetical protein MKW94_005852 [Papaver nudicaule]|uniref:C2H2-type domain-containing protein n=1 Tax=Papaver nudicaule TaxID=74823 RepID=A0AA41RWT5_PAPNU|nr:hypothetical protein [Papaver nudicaule]
MMSIKRSRGVMEESMAATMAKCLRLLSQGEIEYQSVVNHQPQTMSKGTENRIYECKTCNKKFPSFQALGGHRASHKKPRLMELYSSDINENQQQGAKQKNHECSICGLKFATGQALGGHMRRHRATMIESLSSVAIETTTETTGLSPSSSDNSYTDNTLQEEVPPQVPVLKRSNSSRRVLGLNLDLSLSLLPLDKEMEESMAVTMAKCLMLLSRDRGEIDCQSVIQQQQTMPTSTQGRVYECKTCSKQFPSFQALGGHRASHKTRRVMDLYSSENQSIMEHQQATKKQKMHECSICGLKFEIGQALGGHMRKHRAAMDEFSSGAATTGASEPPTTEGLSSSSSDFSQTDITCQEEVPPQMPVLKRSNSSRRVSSLNLELNLSLFPNTTVDSTEFEFSTLVKADKYVLSSTPSMIYSFI